MAEAVRSRLNTQKTNCRWIQTSQQYSLRSNGSRTGPACCSRVPPPDVLTMLLQSSMTTSAARDGVLLRVLAAVRLPGRHAPKWIRSVESAMPSRSMTNVANLQPRMVSAASDGTPFGTPIGPCSAAPIPRSTSSKSCFVTPKSRQRSSTAVRLWRTSAGRTAKS